MGSCENLNAVREPATGAAIERHSDLELLVEPISKQNIFSEADHDSVVPIENVTSEPDGCCCEPLDNNAAYASTIDVTQTITNIKLETNENVNGEIDPDLKNLLDVESRVCSNRALVVAERHSGLESPEKHTPNQNLLSEADHDSVGPIENGSVEQGGCCCESMDNNAGFLSASDIMENAISDEIEISGNIICGIDSDVKNSEKPISKQNSCLESYPELVGGKENGSEPVACHNDSLDKSAVCVASTDVMETIMSDKFDKNGVIRCSIDSEVKNSQRPVSKQASEEPLSKQLSEAPISKQNLCMEADHDSVGPKEHGPDEPDESCCYSPDNSAGSVSSTIVMETIGSDKIEINGDIRCVTDSNAKNSEEPISKQSSEETISKQNSCSDIEHDSVGPKQNRSDQADGCCCNFPDNNDGCDSSIDFMETVAGDKIEVTGHIGCRTDSDANNSKDPIFKHSTEEPISKQNFCSELDYDPVGPKANASNGADGCCYTSPDNNAGCTSSVDVVEKVTGCRIETNGDIGCGIGSDLKKSVDMEAGVCSKWGSAVLDACKVETDELCSEKESSVGPDRSISPLDASQMLYILKPVMKSTKMCLKEVERTGDSNILTSSIDGCGEGSGDFLVVSDNDNQGQQLLSKQSELQQDLTPVASLPENCIEKDERINDETVNVYLVSGVLGDIQEGIDLLIDTHEDTDSPILPSGGSERVSELTSANNLSRNCTKQNELKEVMSTSATCLHDGLEVSKENNVLQSGKEGPKEDTNDVLTSVEANTNGITCNKTSAVQSHQLFSESISETGTLSNCAVYVDAVHGREGNRCSETSSLRAEFLPKLLDNQISVSSCCRDGETDDQGCADLCTNSHEDVADTKINCATFIDDAPLEATDLEKFNAADLPSDGSKKNERMHKENVGGPSIQIAADVSGERSDFMPDVKAENCRQVSAGEQDACGSKAGSSVNGCSLKLDVPDLSEKGAAGFLSSSNLGDCFKLTDNEGRLDKEGTCISETNCPETILSYSRRRGQKNKSREKDQTKMVVSDYRKAERTQESQEHELIFKYARRKRSCSSKPARLSKWGLSRSISEVFCKSNDLASDQGFNKISQKSRSTQGKGKKNKNHISGYPKGSGRKNEASSSGCIRLKVKFGKSGGPNTLNVTAPEVVEHSLSIDRYGTGLHQGTYLEMPKPSNCDEEKSGNSERERKLELNNNPGKNLLVRNPGDSLLHTKPKTKDVECGDFCGKAAEITADADLKLGSDIVAGASLGATENIYIDAGTSPDSEVINSVPDALVSAGHQGDSDHTVLSTSEPIGAPIDVNNLKIGKKKDEKDDTPEGSRLLEEGSMLIGGQNKSKPVKNRQHKQKQGISSQSSETLSSEVCEKASSSTSINGELSSKPSPMLMGNELKVCGAPFEMKCSKNAQESPSTHSEFAEPQRSKKSIKSKGHGLPKSSKCSGVRKSKFSGSAKSRRRDVSGRREDEQKPDNKSIEKDEDAGDQAVARVQFHQETDYNAADAIVKDTMNNVANREMGLDDAVEESISMSESAWVRCDDCYKWRRIPAGLVDSIDGNCRWICSDNVNKHFADCSVPQEMSNEEINAELGITEAEADAYDGDVNYKEVEKGLESRPLPANRKACFKAIKTNQFLHRSRKAQSIDEIMVCHCKPQADGQLGCGEECLNRMLNIECVQGTCPCGELCSNQQFQKRKYAKFQRFQSGKKGYGLKLLEDVCQGEFLIEYVGEVLDMQAYEARQKDYAAKGQKHFYFMTLNGNEVIDAGAKGNLGRFINHSCEPNCRTEKWMVNGEICVGIFALRDIKKEEELTFDYNYVRVFGAAAKKCYCGSPHCRGYIGGDPLNGDVVVQSDSDEEYSEPVMLEDDEAGDGMVEATTKSCIVSEEVKMGENRMKESEKINDSRTTVQASVTAESEDRKVHVASAFAQMKSSVDIGDSEGMLSSPSQPLEVSLTREDGADRATASVHHGIPKEGESASRSLSSVLLLETSSSMVVSKVPTDGAAVNKKPNYVSGEDKRSLPRSRPLMKTSRSSGSRKKEKGSSNPPGGNKVPIVTANKSHQQPIRSRGLGEVSSSGRNEGVEVKLNELLDTEGGISKRKDSTKGYLKLLLLTAASRGNASSEGIQSNRDLSMILDALLKTKSRAVLVDIINKNGLQMLHNIMKQYRRDFKRIPILRKLLKVLEYLAVRDILTLDHIIRGPPCLGMESFRESMLTLTEHNDKQVHQIARNFRDRWIPRPYRKVKHMDRNQSKFEFQRDSNSFRFSAPQPYCHDQNVKPTETVVSTMPSKVVTTSVSSSTTEVSSESNISVSQTNGTIRKRKSRWDQPAENKQQKSEPSLPAVSGGDQNIQEDAPPGFSSPFRQPLFVSSKVVPDVVVAFPQQKFISRLPVSYGIPLTIVQEFGTTEAEATDGWVVAPGMPFHPFPPLPPFAREKNNEKKNSSAISSLDPTAAREHQTPTCSGEGRPSNTTLNEVGGSNPGADLHTPCKRTRGSSFDIGKRYFRQQKWNIPPRLRNGWGNTGSKYRSGMDDGVESGNVTHEKISNSQGTAGCRVEAPGYNSYQQKQ